MCYSDESRPPLPPVGGAAADQGDIRLTASDGTRLMAYFARASEPTGAGMVVMPDVRGLHPFFKELAQRFAEAGIDSVAIDYFARTADTDDRGESFDYAPLLPKTTNEHIAADVGAAMEYLRSPEGGAVRSLFTVGFCWGGSNSWNQSAAHPDIAGAIGFYGRPPRSEPFISKMKAPLQVMVAGADGATTPEQSAQFDRDLTAAGVPHEQHIFKGAPHSFFDRTYEQWADASAEAWRLMLDFVNKHSSPVAARR